MLYKNRLCILKPHFDLLKEHLHYSKIENEIKENRYYRILAISFFSLYKNILDNKEQIRK